MFPKNLNSIEEDISKKRLEETQKQLLEKPRKRFWQLSSTLIAGIIIVGAFILFLWIMQKIRY
ncbi:hypothetical protein [Paenibacillus antibioticophila]|uniref:Uncharacterized protein n=1 Tax=Paenibacillus antibioticophila TaxID=1274374 RepID=A0A919XSI1_9BACL|nr:hypothetical protein [Paenibacillus antibioticophila]GIO37606.1 hypothetical protein J41TS12_24670 [Paenibacillus antibioticophila]